MQILFRFIIGGLVVSPFAAFCRRVEARRAHRRSKAQQHGRQKKNLRVYCEATREQSTLEPSESPFVKRKSEGIGG
jgi:hypothetical protein